MKQYVKLTSGLSASNPTKIKTFDSITDLCDAIDNGDITEGEQWQIDQRVGVSEDIVADVDYLMSVTPSCASVSNWLATIADVTGSSDTFIPRLVALETTIVDKTDCTYSTALASRVGVNETNITNLQNTIVHKVDCDDFNTLEGRVSTNETTLVSHTTSITGINTALSNKVECDDFNTLSDTVDSIDTALTSTSNRVANLLNKPGLDCIGTVTEDDIADLTSCKGTVTSIYDESSNTQYQPDANGQIKMPVYLGTVKAICDEDGNQCFVPDSDGVVCLSGLSGGASYSMTGNTLTITF